jgi:alkaline phosphatase D
LIKKIKVIGVWDDHDYGANNMDGSFKKKYIMRDVFLDFIEEPKNSQRRLET